MISIEGSSTVLNFAACRQSPTRGRGPRPSVCPFTLAYIRPGGSVTLCRGLLEMTTPAPPVATVLESTSDEGFLFAEELLL